MQLGINGGSADFLNSAKQFDSATQSYAPNLQWEFVVGNVLRNVSTGFCLDAGGWSKDESAKLVIWDWTVNAILQCKVVK